MRTKPSITAIYALTKKGKEIGLLLKNNLNADLFVSQRLANKEENNLVFDSLPLLIQDVFFKYKNHIFITATGIAVRCIAPHITSKQKDPAVIVVDQNGRFCISLLSGHLGGANDLAKTVARLIGAQPVITTATDLEGITSIDIIAKKKKLHILNPEAIKIVNSALLEGEAVQVYDPEDRLDIKVSPFKKVKFVFLKENSWNPNMCGVWVHWREKIPTKGQLVLHPKVLILGIGCNRGTKEEEILNFIEKCFKEKGLSIFSIKALATIDIKKDEKGILKVARYLKVPVLFFSKDELNSVEVPHPSCLTKQHVGAKSVCEAAAILGTNMGKLILPKQKTKDITIAVALQK